MLIRRVRELRAEGTTTVDLQVTLQPGSEIPFWKG